MQGWACTGLYLIWDRHGDWAGGQWGWPGRAVIPLGHLQSLSLQKATDERRLADMYSSLTQESLVVERPPTPPRSLTLVIRHHQKAVLAPEPVEAEPEGEKAELGAWGCPWMGGCWAPQGGAWCGARIKDWAQGTQQGDCSQGDFPVRVHFCWGFSGRPQAGLCL